jgi:hypothetical protein
MLRALDRIVHRRCGERMSRSDPMARFGQGK